MKLLLFISGCLVFTFGCSTKKSIDFEYFKVLAVGGAETVTQYNKGMGLYGYAYYDPKTDSILFRNLIEIDPLQFEDYIGKLDNDRLLDTIRLTIDALRKYKSGFTYHTTWTGNAYCGPELYVEFKDSQGIHYYNFIVDNNDTLRNFCYFFSRFSNLPWKKKLADTPIVNSDKETVNALTRLGVYQNLPIPYIPFLCEPGIDFKYITGTWRTIEERHNKISKTNYTKLTVLKDGTCFLQKVKLGDESTSIKRKYKLYLKDSSLNIHMDGKLLHKYIILKLTENCFEYKKENDEYVIRWDRLSL